MVNPITDIDVSTFLKIYQMDGFTRNLSTQSPMWDYVMKRKIKDAMAKELRYLVVNQLGYAAQQAMPADGSGAYPRASRTEAQEAAAHYKEWSWTVNVPRSILNKEGPMDAQYAKILQVELDNKAIVNARMMSVVSQGDGSGAIGRIVGTPTVSAGKISVVISDASSEGGRSFIRWIQPGDHIKAANIGGTAHNTVATGVDAAYLKVLTVDDVSNVVVLEPYSSADAVLTAVTGQFNIAANDYLYRRGSNIPNLSSIAVDYETLSHVMVGLESLAANDGRLVHGLTKSGNLGGTVKDVGGSLLGLSHFQSALSSAKRAAGEGRYKYSEAFMADETFDAFVEANEADRRLKEGDNAKRGFKSIGMYHRKDFVSFQTDEFVPRQRVRILPDSKDALAFIGGTPEQVAPNGSDKYRLSLTTDYAGQNAYGRENVTSFEQQGVLITKHAAPIITLQNFSLASAN